MGAAGLGLVFSVSALPLKPFILVILLIELMRSRTDTHGSRMLRRTNQATVEGCSLRVEKSNDRGGLHNRRSAKNGPGKHGRLRSHHMTLL